MSFTDEVLAELKKDFLKPDNQDRTHDYESCDHCYYDWPALVARLESAEECAEYLDAMEAGDKKGSQALGIIESWRKAKGE